MGERTKPPLCGDRRDDAITSYRCDLYRDHYGPHHQIGTPVYWDKEENDGR